MTRVLCVNADRDLLDLVKIFLEEDGSLEVETTTSVEDAINLVSCGEHDVIVVDYYMPDVEGGVISQEIEERFGIVPFILIAGRENATEQIKDVPVVFKSLDFEGMIEKLKKEIIKAVEANKK